MMKDEKVERLGKMVPSLSNSDKMGYIDGDER